VALGCSSIHIARLNDRRQSHELGPTLGEREAFGLGSGASARMNAAALKVESWWVAAMDGNSDNGRANPNSLCRDRERLIDSCGFRASEVLHRVNPIASLSGICGIMLTAFSRTAHVRIRTKLDIDTASARMQPSPNVFSPSV